MNILSSIYIFIIVFVIILLKDFIVKSSNKKQNIFSYVFSLLITSLIIVVCIYLLQTFVVENFRFEVSAPRKLGMQENVLPLIKPGDDIGYINNIQNVNYPVQGSGITCSKAYIGHEGNLNMNIGEWKRGNGEGIPARPDIYLKGNATKVPFAANCETCEVNPGSFEIENPDKPCPSPYFENADKKVVQENYEGDKIIMYYSDSCGFCGQAKQVLKDVMGQIELRNTKDHPLPKGIRGVPHFEYNGKSHTGCPSDANDLFAKLEMVQENYEGDKIIMYYSDSCGFCGQAKQVLKDVMDKIELRNTKDHPLPKGIGGVPHFEYNGKSHTGCPSDANDLFAKLEMVQENYEGDKIIMYYSDSCGFCGQAKQVLKDVMDKIELRNTKDHPLPKGIGGVPHFEYNGKSHTGCPSDANDLFAKLEMVQENYEGDKIIMYYSDSCGFCGQAKQVLKDVMDKIELRNTKDHPLPKGIGGVPHFEYNGKSHTGCPSDANDLFVKLEMVQENYEPKPYNSQYFDYNNYIAPYEKSVVDTLSCYSGGCPLKNKSGKVGVPFV